MKGMAGIVGVAQPLCLIQLEQTFSQAPLHKTMQDVHSIGKQLATCSCLYEVRTTTCPWQIGGAGTCLEMRVLLPDIGDTLKNDRDLR